MASRCDAAKELMRYYHEKGDYRKAADYALGYQQANDSVIRERQFDLTRNAQAEYHYQRNKAAEEALVRHGERVRLWSIVGGLLCVIAVQTIVATYFYRKKQMHETIIGKEKEIGKAKNLIAQKETDLVAKNNELKELNRKQEETTRQLMAAERQLALTKETLKAKTTQNEDLMKLVLSGRAVENAPGVIEHFKATALGQNGLEPEDWGKLFAAVDTLYPSFHYHLQSNIKHLREPILRTAYLIQVGLTTTEIANIMDTPVQTAWNRVDRIRKLMGN